MVTKSDEQGIQLARGSSVIVATSSQLQPAEMETVDLLASRFERSEQDYSPEIEEVVLAADVRLRVVLLTKLLDIEIESRRRKGARLPTLCELEGEYPRIGSILPLAYSQLDSELRVPTLLGGYRLERVLDHGQQGRLALAHLNQAPETKVAVKYATGKSAGDRLLREAQFLSRLADRGVPALINRGVSADGTAFLIMEHLRGENLHDFLQGSPDQVIEIRSKRRLNSMFSTPMRNPAYRGAFVCLRIARILGHIHAEDILHRDLSPKNVFVEQSGGIRIIDFGLAVDARTSYAPRAPLDEFYGTPAYKAPEQLAKDASANGKLSDIYSVGRILLACVLGEDAVVDSYLFEQRLSNGIEAGLTKLPVISDRWLATIQEKACDPDPSQRYASADELANDLQRYLQSVVARRILVRRVLPACLIGAPLAGLLAHSTQTSELPEEKPSFPLAPAFRKQIDVQNLMFVLANADMDALESYEKEGLMVDAIADAFTRKQVGEERAVAAQFLEASLKQPRALEWLDRQLQRGLDPQLIVPGIVHPRESLLPIAWKVGNVPAMKLLLRRGASPHGFEEIDGDQWPTPRMLYPYYNLLHWDKFTQQQVRELAFAFREAGACMPEAIPNRGSTSQTNAIEECYAESKKELGIELSPTPHLWHNQTSIFADETRHGKGWQEFLINMPKHFAVHEDTPQALAGGTLTEMVIRHLLCIVDGRAYFMGFTKRFGRILHLSIETDIEGALWKFNIYGSTGLWGSGKPRIDPDEKDVDSASLRSHWQYYTGRYDPLKLTMTFQESYVYNCFRNDADVEKYNAAHSDKKSS